MTKVCWNGCSFTVGEGFAESQRNDYIYRCLVDKHFGFTSDLLATGGASNYKIFMQTAQAIMSNRYNIVFTQWSGLNRLWLHPGPDSHFFVNDQQDIDFNYRDIYLSRKDKQNLKDQLLVLNHDYQNIIDLIHYCNILERLSQYTGTKIIFINGLVPWASDLNTDIDNRDLSSTLSLYTKRILDFDHRDNQEIVKFFKNLQKEFATLNQSLWVNLFDSMAKNTVDIGPEGHHPGIQSHQIMYNKILTYLEENQ